MPETVVAPTAPVTPAPAAPAAPEAPKLTGIEAAMKDFEVQTTPKAKAKETTPDPKPKGEPKPGDKPAEVKPDKPKADLDWEKAPGHYKGAHYQMRRTYDEKVASLEKQITEIKSKPSPAGADPKLAEQHQARIKELEQRISALDYQQSGEFKKQYTDKFNSDYKDAVGKVKTLKVYSHQTNEDGTVKDVAREATKEDLDRLFNMTDGERDVAIQAFGPSATRVAAIMENLFSTIRASERAVQDHAQNSEQRELEQRAATEKEQSTYQASFENSVKELEKTWPQFFAADEKDPEASEALNTGYKYIDDVLEKVKVMTVEDRAAANAVIRARAAGFNRAVLDGKRKDTKIAELETELKKFRRSDPGEATEHHEQDLGEDEIPAGIDAASKAVNFGA